MRMFQKVIGLAMMMMAFYGCGSGSGSSDSSSVITDSYVFPAGKATLTFTAANTAQLPVSIRNINLSITLPTGMSVDTTNASGEIDATSTTALVKSGSALQWGSIAGTYTASTGKVLLGMTTSGDTFRSGEFLRLTCNVASSSVTTLGDLKTLNPSGTLLVSAGGFDSTTTSTVDLTSMLAVTLGTVK